MSLDMMTRAETEKLPVFEEHSEHRMGSLYLWAGFTDTEYAFFVRPAAENELGCLADVFAIHDGIVRFLAREMFIREGGKLRLLEEA
ncbi:hypothetical protein [Streptomyces albogriseolus]|uniref:hypothetical protein n=1 Tax=Streptomyces albogriseolus TaxID=1887 RepID=UPI00384D2B8E